jgi:hypothetical protein
MKLTPSLRIDVLIIMLLTGISTILILSVLSVHYFISGMEKTMQSVMYSQAQDQQVTDGQPQTSHFLLLQRVGKTYTQRSNKIFSLNLVSLMCCIKPLSADHLLSHPKKAFLLSKSLKVMRCAMCRVP